MPGPLSNSMPGPLSNSFLPPARQLHRENQLVQEHIRKTQLKQDYTKTLTEKLESKHLSRRQKILIVANRLPTQPKCDADGNWTFTRCSGGLVSCLAGIHQKFDMVWIGWPGSDIPEADKDVVSREAMKQNCYPVFLNGDLIEGYYNGFANNVLWPLFHYIMPPFDKGVNECSTGQWEAYKKANELFVQAILQVYEDDDYVWVHDYHLMLVPKLMRDQKPDANIGWFLHTPFPSAEIYRTLPWRQELVESLLHANLLGFHVYDYLRHFMNSVVQLTSLEISQHTIDATSLGGCVVTCATMPIGISPNEFTEELEKEYVQQQVEKLREQYGGRRVILGIDRLDYMKGIPHKLRAFGCFLDLHPELAGDCVLVQLAVPSRRDVPEYQRLQRQVHELVGQICGKHSRVETGAPVIYLDASMCFQDLVALYHVADVALITSLRDGMNLVSYEFIACHKNRDPPGVLILSEFAGAAQSLGAGSIRVNPWDLQDTANAIYEALEMPREDRVALHKYAFNYVHEHTAQKWAETFLQSLQEACSDLMEVTAEVPPLLPYEELLNEWSESTTRLIIIDILECLVPAKRPTRENRRKKAMTMPSDLMESLRTLANSPNTMVILTSDKPREVLAQAVGSLPVILAPEGCSVYRKIGSTEWIHVPEESELAGLEEWMDGVKSVFDYFRERTPGSHIEKQECMYRWYWDHAQFDFGSAQAREVLIHLWAGPLVNSEAEVVVGDRSITVRPHACSRSACLEKLLETEMGSARLHKVDFALCFAAVSHRDEDVYESLQHMLDVCQFEEDAINLDLHRDSISEASEHDSGASSAVHTPVGAPPPVKPGELPPAYDWVPTAQRERNRLAQVEPASPAPHHPPSEPCSEAAPMDERPPLCSCYTLSLGMRKTKAQHVLPHPYHVQNLIRAMSARLPTRSEE
eukprot:TRINITY_DN28075_c0_g1_i1.p1 TRINITY_DN28075_c0_g1~~TRINITY_DN28075_c0_g1_i1.p1  ORF type:complete len:923 (+),score=159.75 TRINITY_DN28075_c0_g1_i1:198-2966(+)